MTTATIEQIQSHLPELLGELQPGDEIIIQQNGDPVAKLIRTSRTSWPCEPGSAKHLPHWMAPDFDAPLEENLRSICDEFVSERL